LLDVLRKAAPDGTAFDEQPMRRAPGALYPTPHGARFDFEATACGAEWIDDLAARALEQESRRPRAPMQLVHKDFRIENAPVDDDRLAAVYDWDSLAFDDEMAALANAASTFSVDWSSEAPRFPTPAETAAFVADYEGARGRRLDPDELERLEISRTLLLSYIARCEHSDAGGVAAAPAGSARALLAARARVSAR
jgi:Ser/Thr protein kinase RdoA (MazF antagonist)